MVYMLCRNKVKDFNHWKTIFEVSSIEKANEFINAPKSAKVS